MAVQEQRGEGQTLGGSRKDDAFLGGFSESDRRGGGGGAVEVLEVRRRGESESGGSHCWRCGGVMC